MVNFYIQREGESAVDIEDIYEMRVVHVEGLHPSDYKPIFKRDWATEDGVDILFPAIRKTKSRNVTITIYMTGVNYLDNYENFVIFVSEKKFDYWDTLRGKKVALVFDSANTPEWIQYTSNQLQFKITFLNYSGRNTTI
jgi:hypothetical protein